MILREFDTSPGHSALLLSIELMTEYGLFLVTALNVN